MTEGTQPSSDEKSCTICGIKSEERILLCGIDKDKTIWVCVRCLPRLIHGVH
jgi:hypothetical protein